jgi:Na+/H+-dicarboxylate symporter
MKKFFNIENLTLIGIFLGFITGFYLPDISSKIKILGDIFLTLLKLIIVPLIFTSVLVAIISLGSIKKFKNLGIKTLLYYLITTALSILLGLILVNVLEPGKNFHIPSAAEYISKIEKLTFKDLVWNIVPSNPFESFTKGKILQIIFFSIIFGLSILSLEKDKISSLFNFFDALNSALINLTKWIIKLTPVGVFSLVSYTVAETGIKIIFPLGKYVITVVLGLLIHALFTLAILGFLLGKYNPYAYLVRVREALFLAFSTASSAATLPVSLEIAEEKEKIKKEVAGFILPLGATINMDGTALYEAVAAVFIANIYGISLSFYQLFIIFITATLASIGAAAIPGAGLIMLTLVLSSAGIPLEGIGIILAVDRFLDMLRTAVNVWGDLNGAKIIDRFIN